MNSNATVLRFPFLTLLAFALTACGSGDTDSPAGPGGPGGPGGPPATTSVTVQDNQFSPSAIRVSTGATVTWTWSGSAPHNVTWVGGVLAASATQSSGTFQSTMPSTTGELVYFCTIHGTATSGMRGTVLVE